MTFMKELMMPINAKESETEVYPKEQNKSERKLDISKLRLLNSKKTREELWEKDRKVELFLKNKSNFGKDKRIKYEELEREKKEENDKFEKMINKKNIDKNVLNSIKEMFSSNPQINDLIQKLDDALEKREKNFGKKNFGRNTSA